MPLDVVRLRDSNIASIEAEPFRAAVLSWCVAWHQVPAASLPDDDTVLCRLLGYGRDLKGWKKLRDGGALKGYVKCSDGRLYHPVVAEKAVEGWKQKVAQRLRTEAARSARWQKQSHNKDSSVTESVDRSVTESKGTEVKGTEGNRGSLRSPQRPNVSDRSEFDRFWTMYPRKVGKDAAQTAWIKARKQATAEGIISGLRVYKFEAEPRYQPHATTWLNEGRWKAEPDTLPLSVAPEVRNGRAPDSRLQATEFLLGRPLPGRDVVSEPAGDWTSTIDGEASRG